MEVALPAAIVALFLAASHTSDAATIAYVYDSLGRVVQVTYGNGRVITYIYDAAGNRLTYTVTSP
jgi:YD repeat-containing protein